MVLISSRILIGGLIKLERTPAVMIAWNVILLYMKVGQF